MGTLYGTQEINVNWGSSKINLARRDSARGKSSSAEEADYPRPK